MSEIIGNTDYLKHAWISHKDDVPTSAVPSDEPYHHIVGYVEKLHFVSLGGQVNPNRLETHPGSDGQVVTGVQHQAAMVDLSGPQTEGYEYCGQDGTYYGAGDEVGDDVVVCMLLHICNLLRGWESWAWHLLGRTTAQYTGLKPGSVKST